jgi:hypothetical protein
MAQPVAPSVPEAGTGPLDVTTSATEVHAGQEGDSIVLSFNNRTIADVDVTVTVNGVDLLFTVPAKSLEALGPFGVAGSVTVTAASADAIRCLVGIVRWIAGA